MFNQDLNSDPNDYRRQVDDEPDEDQEDTPHGNLDSEVRKIAANLKRAAFSSCINEIEVEDEYTLVKNIWQELQGIVRKPLIREVVIITAILLLKTSLFMAYCSAKKHGLEIVNL
jgi:hypothetical protein